MAQSVRRRVNTVGIQLVRGAISPQAAPVLLPLIIRDTYGIQDEELYGVALNGAYKVFVKLLNTDVYERLVEKYQDVRVDVNSMVSVRLHDVSRHYTWVRVRNVPFEADETDIRNVFKDYGTVHLAQPGKWVEGAYVGYPEGTFSLKMTIRHPIPSYVILEAFRTQLMVAYAGQRRTFRHCGGYDHIAAYCEQQTRLHGVECTAAGEPGQVGRALEIQEGRGPGRLWSEEVEEAEVVAGADLTAPVTGGPVGPILPDGGGRHGSAEEAIDEVLENVLTSLFPQSDGEGELVTRADVRNAADLCGQQTEPIDLVVSHGALCPEGGKVRHVVEVEVHREVSQEVRMGTGGVAQA
nr:uncharacterized protein LOC128702506 [Cherax quadricarinatus]